MDNLLENVKTAWKNRALSIESLGKRSSNDMSQSSQESVSCCQMEGTSLSSLNNPPLPSDSQETVKDSSSTLVDSLSTPSTSPVSTPSDSPQPGSDKQIKSEKEISNNENKGNDAVDSSSPSPAQTEPLPVNTHSKSHESSPSPVPSYLDTKQHKRSSSDPSKSPLPTEEASTTNGESMSKKNSFVFKFDAKNDVLSCDTVEEDIEDEPFSIQSKLSWLKSSLESREGSTEPEPQLSASCEYSSQDKNVDLNSSGAGDLSQSVNISNNNRSSFSSKSSDKKKKGYWYNVLSPSYKSKSEDFRKIFKDVPDTERLIVDYACALQKDILVQGRLYITQGWICFYANIFRWETVLTIRCKDVTSITKEKTARVIPNAIQICTENDKYFFTSFAARDKTFLMLFRVWQNALIDNQMNQEELWSWVHYSYGEELGLTSSDDDYVPPTQTDKVKFELESQLEKEPQEDEPFLNGDVGLLPSNSSVGDYLSQSVNLTNRSTQLKTPTSTRNGPKPPSSLDVPRSSAISSNGELPTDMGDTTEDDESEIQCTGHEHNGFTSLDDVYYIPVDKLFSLLFSDSNLYREFIAARKTYDLVLGEWVAAEDGVDKVRDISYTLSLNYSIGPKCSPSTEKQTMYSEFTKPGSIYVIDTEVVNGGVPYSDNFYVVNRYCITRISSNKTRLVITSQVKFRTKAWGLVKRLLLKTAREGLDQNFQLLGEFLHKEAEHAPHTTPSQPVKKKRTRRRKISERPASVKKLAAAESHQLGHVQPSRQKVGVTSPDALHIDVSVDTLVRCICIVLILLVFFNAVLFYKLWSLERQASFISQKYTHRAEFKNPPKDSEEWLKLLEQQEQLHETEILRWKDIIGSSVTLMDHMKLTLKQLQDSLDRRNVHMKELRTNTND